MEGDPRVESGDLLEIAEKIQGGGGMSWLGVGKLK